MLIPIIQIGFDKVEKNYQTRTKQITINKIKALFDSIIEENPYLFDNLPTAIDIITLGHHITHHIEWILCPICHKETSEKIYHIYDNNKNIIYQIHGGIIHFLTNHNYDLHPDFVEFLDRC